MPISPRREPCYTHYSPWRSPLYQLLHQGTLVNAVRNGDWVLLDEINLASTETLECLSGLLESEEGSIVLVERGLVVVSVNGS